MFTSNFASLKAIPAGLTAVRISRSAPRWMKGGWAAHLPQGVTARDYLALAPSAAALKEWQDDNEDYYHRDFNGILAKMNPERVYRELTEQAVLLCFCDAGCFCHRRIVSEWIEHHLGVTIPELGFARSATPHFATPAYDWHPLANLATSV